MTIETSSFFTVKYKHLFFDLDRTLWDFEQNMLETMQYLYDEFLPDYLSQRFETYVQVFNAEHELLWEKYRNGLINKEYLRKNRFYLTLKKLGCDNRELSALLNRNYMELCPAKTNLFPHTREILNYLHPNYNLYILTNGFISTQHRKLANCGLTGYFGKLYSSEEIGYNKPHKKIFAWAVSSLNAKKNECLMIGDDPITDVQGAKKYGIDQVYFNPEKNMTPVDATFEINDLIELQKFL